MNSRSIYGCFAGIFLFFAGCSNDPGGDNHILNNQIDVQLTMTFGDYTSFNTKDQQQSPGTCASVDEMKSLATSEKLIANVSILRAGQSIADNYSVKIRFVENKFVADSIALPLGENILEKYTVSDISGAQTKTLFSGISIFSNLYIYAQFIPSGYLLPYRIKLKETDIDKNIPVNVYVLCAVRDTEPVD